MMDAASDFCQRWRNSRHSWRHRSEGGFDARRYDVAAAPEADAKAFVTANHYSASYPAARLRFGLYDGPWLVGVAVLGVPMQRRVLSAVFPDLEPYAESLELSRFVLAETVPANGESWFLARCWQLAAQLGIRGVVSFSDPVPRRTAVGEIVFPAISAPSTRRATPSTSAGRRRGASCYCPTAACSASALCPRYVATSRGMPTAERELMRFGARPRRMDEPGAVWLREALGAAGVRSIVHGGNHRYAFRLGARRRFVAVGLPAVAYPRAVAA